MSTVCLISDIHLEYLSAHEKNLLLKFLEKVPQEASHLILNGDAFDAPSDGRKKAFPDNFDVVVAIQELLKRGVKFTYVVGNHDIAISALTMKFEKPQFEVVYPSFTLELVKGKRIWIEHGHTYDPFYKTHIYSIAQLIEEISGVDPGEAAVEILRRVTSILRMPQKKPYFGVPSGVLKIWEEAAAKKIEENRFDVVVMGHTHAPGIWKINGGFYVNTGSWIENTNYVICDEEKIQLLDFRRKKVVKEVSI